MFLVSRMGVQPNGNRDYRVIINAVVQQQYGPTPQVYIQTNIANERKSNVENNWFREFVGLGGYSDCDSLFLLHGTTHFCLKYCKYCFKIVLGMG